MKRLALELPKIEKGVPLPKLRYQPGSYGQSRSLWRPLLLSMEPGDSFVLLKNQLQSLMVASKKCGVRITWRKHSSTEYRVWCVPEALQPTKPRRLWLKDEKRQVPHPEGTVLVGKWEEGRSLMPGTLGAMLRDKLEQAQPESFISLL